MDLPRLIEFAFPLKQASLDSVHEKNVRHGHISTLHIWPARRPLAACRAALLATLLPDPSAEPKPEGMGDDDWQKEIQRRRQELCEKIGGKLVKKIEKKKMPGGQIVEREKEETEGGILHWGRETENAETLDWFRQQIKKAYGGGVPKVLDPFAGGGAIPLEAMRLGCETTAIDINPVAWFILRCTLEYPQKLAGKTLPLPEFILSKEEFMTAFYKAHPHLVGRTKRTKKQEQEFSQDLFLKDKPDDGRAPRADLAWHVRAWGQWVLDRARRELALYYPVYADFEPLQQGKPYERQPMRLVPLKDDGRADVEAFNGEFSQEYLKIKTNPRWVIKPTVAHLWARTVTCKNCRATIPLLKTRWLSKKERKRVLLAMTPNADRSGVHFEIETNVPTKGVNVAQRRESDKRLAAGTMSRAGATCPCCKTIMTMADLRVEAQAQKFGTEMTAVVIDAGRSKDYRLPTAAERLAAKDAAVQIDRIFSNIPLGVVSEPTPSGGGTGAGRAFSVQSYGMMTWADLFTPRQLLSMGHFALGTGTSKTSLVAGNYSEEWIDAIEAYLYCALSRLADRNSELCTWQIGADKIGHTFARFALPITWDFVEVMPWADASGGYAQALEWVSQVADHALLASVAAPAPRTSQASVLSTNASGMDLVVTDPPYYDAIPYSDLMDFFLVWLRRAITGWPPPTDNSSTNLVSPKWDNEKHDGELIDDDSRQGGNRQLSKSVYEDGMFRAFQVCNRSLKENGRFVIVFAQKRPDAWETLVSAMIRAGFVVDSSWPIQTERIGRMRSMSSAALSSSVWLVCKKRAEISKPGWDTKVLQEMRANITHRLRDFWDVGIRGPDFVWAATGPALEAYSKYPIVKKADDPGQVLTVSEFLSHVRRMVVDFVVGRVLGGDAAPEATADRLDEPTAYYLLHRDSFGLDEAPVGACILYATACGLSDQALARDWDLLVRTGGDHAATESEADEDADADEEGTEDTGSGSKVKLKAWNQRRGRSMGYEAPGGRPIPLIDRIHRLMQRWKTGDVHKVDEYLDEHGLRRHELFRRVLQSLIELSKRGSDERSLLESLSNHIGAKGARRSIPELFERVPAPDGQETS